MSFTSTNGTRGARQPKANRLTQWMNKYMANRIRRKGGKVVGMNGLVLTTVGRKSGEERSTPVGWFPGPNDSWLIVASAAGAPKNPAWYYNLAAHPDKVRIEMAGKTIAVRAEQLSGIARDEAWHQIKTDAPRFAKYEQQTDRELPIIQLSAVRT